MTQFLILWFLLLQPGLVRAQSADTPFPSPVPLPVIVPLAVPGLVDSVAINMAIKKELIEERAQLLDSVERFKNELKVAKAIQDGRPYQVKHNVGTEYWIFFYRIVRLDTASSKLDTVYIGVKRKKKSFYEY
jgi:hypothetical protein